MKPICMIAILPEPVTDRIVGSLQCGLEESNSETQARLRMSDKDTTEKDRVLSANLEFYRAFTLRNVRAMDGLWARTLPVSCVHPGWMALRDREAVMRSWHDILANPEAPHIMCHDEDATLYGTVAIVTCEETLDDNTLVATNIFAQEDGVWRLVHHQAGPLLMRAGHGGSGARRLN
jgi:predicted nuclease with RNAse H fold